MDEAHVTTIAVEPQSRGKRIGERVLVAMLEECVRRGVRRVSLEVRERNKIARRLYEKYGFVGSSVRRGYYSDNGEDAIVMTIADLLSPAYRAKLRELKRRSVEDCHYEERPSSALASQA